MKPIFRFKFKFWIYFTEVITEPQQLDPTPIPNLENQILSHVCEIFGNLQRATLVISKQLY